MHPTFRLHTREEPGRVRVVLEGELDTAAGEQLERCLDELARLGRAVLLDIRGVTFMDSGGLAQIVRGYIAASGDGWIFAVTRPHHEAVERLFELVGLPDVMPLAQA